MPRRPRYCPAGLPSHVIVRGNNRQTCFASNEDMSHFAHWLAEAAQNYAVQIHAWVFMTNHVHLLATPAEDRGVSAMMQHLGRLYVRYFNRRYDRTGGLFEGRFKSSVVQDELYFLTCQRYIELNPVRANLVKDPADYFWSSYGCHAFGVSARMWTPHDRYLVLDSKDTGRRQRSYRNLFREVLSREVISEIRQSVNTGLSLGSEDFKRQVEKLTGQPQFLRRRGPAPSGEGPRHRGSE